MRVLLLAIYYPPDRDPTGDLLHAIAAGLVRRGHAVDVVTTLPHAAGLRVADGWRGRGFVRQEADGVRVLRVPVIATGRKDRLADRALSYAGWCALAAAAPWAARTRPDVILATSGGFATGLSAWLAGAGRTPTVLSVQDLYPEAAVATGKLRPGPLTDALSGVARLMYRAADRIVVNTEAAAAHLAGAGVRAGKIDVVENFVDTDAVAPGRRRNRLSAELGLHGAFVVGYAGNIGWAYDWPLVLDVADRLRARPDVRFLVVGEGAGRADLVAAAARRDLRSMTFLPFQPAERLGDVRAASDVQIVPYRPGAAAASMASKVYAIMASGRPVWAAAEADSPLARLVLAAGCGVVTAPGDAVAAAEALVRLQGDAAARRRMARAGRRAAVTRHGLPAALDAWSAVLERAAADRRPRTRRT